MRSLTRRFMEQMEKDLGTRLDWVAVDHVDTGQPHTHIILRGRDDREQNLVIAREYISRGMRERITDLVTTDLGPRLDRDIRDRLRLEVSAERLTSIDRGLLRRADAGRFLSPNQRDPFRHALETGRLRKLELLGLAQPLPSGTWQLEGDVEDRLRRLGERGDIIRTMQRAITAEKLQRGPTDRVVHSDPPATPIVGRLVERGLADEFSDRHYVLVDATDGRLHHVPVGRSGASELIPSGAIVRISATPAQAPQPSRPARFVDAVRLETLSPVPLERLPRWPGLTWLDRQLLADTGDPVRDSGFGRDVRSALAIRRQWLLDQGLASSSDGQLRAAPGLIETLRERDLTGAGTRLGQELNLPFVPARPGERISGIIERRVDLPSGSYALVANSQEFTLVPWRPLLERKLGSQLSGIMRESGVSWHLGRGRGGPSIG
ncbi:DUF3363 domain-containing protein [Sphingomonas sabuli]|uniref:DUF3363 domain-containing protein n=1 Tax=Sphingomonas sabuli TaxID=2764186 RepID=UPI003CCD5900